MMSFPLRRILSVVLLLFQAWAITNGAEQKFPTMEQIFNSFYESEVQITDLLKNDIGYAKEYYDNTTDQGRLDLLNIGERNSFFYFKLYGDILQINETSCVSKTIADSGYSKMAIYHGWLNQNPLIIGPTALLWFATNETSNIKKTIEYKNTEEVRGIECDRFQVKAEYGTYNMMYDYYFAVSTWSSPNGKNGLRIPIRIAMKGRSKPYGSDEPVDVEQLVDYSYFRPMISDFDKLLPPIGLGCIGRMSDIPFPKIPDEFAFYEEEFDWFDVKNHDKFKINYNGIFFQGRRQLARRDEYSMTGSTSKLNDFNTGVTYFIEDNRKCEIKPLEHSFFENEGGDVYQEKMKNAKEVLGLDGDFYYMGSRKYRGIDVKVFEKADYNSTFLGINNYLTVITVFFTGSLTSIIKDAEEIENNVPVFWMDSLYNVSNNLSYRKQYNIFGFDDAVGTAITDTFPIQDCFPLKEQKTYITLLVKEGDEIRNDIQNNHNQFIVAIKTEIMKLTNISYLRIPYLKINYQSGQIYVIGLLLDRPPAIKQFHLLYHNGYTTLTDKRKQIVEAKNAEQCAYACVNDKKCGSFHFCGNDVCVVNLEPRYIPPTTKPYIENCDVYFRAEMNSNNKEEYLGQVIKKLEDAIMNQNFKISIYVGNETTIVLTVTYLTTGIGPYEKDPVEKDYITVFPGSQLKPSSQSDLILDKEYVDTELDCYKSCRMENSFDCESFSYCAQSEKKQCRISSELFIENMTPIPKTVTTNEQCTVHSLKYLEYFERNEGKVLMRQGDVSKKIHSAEKCAMECRKLPDLPCRSFDYCSTAKTCTLHKTHITDVHPSEVITHTENTCIHYSAKFSADYNNKGHHFIVDESDKRIDVTVEKCARSCSEENPSCRNFIYCPGDGIDVPICFLTKLDATSDGVKWREAKNCTMYEKKESIKDWRSKKAPIIPKFSGYTKSGFTGLIIGMIIFGLFIGVIGLLGYSYYRSRQPTDGMTVRFMKQTNA